MPASIFVSKGCTLSYKDLNKVFLTDKTGKTLFSGKEIDGLFYFKGNTHRGSHEPGEDSNSTTTTSEPTTFSPDPDCTGIDSPLPSTFFGLKPGNITANSNDLQKQLYDAHCSYGHLHFNMLRKMFGLKKGDNLVSPEA